MMALWTMRAIVGIAAVKVFISCETLDSGSIEIRDDQRRFVDAEFYSSDYALAPSLRLTGRIGIDSNGVVDLLNCSATVVRYDKVLTAGHCLRAFNFNQDVSPAFIVSLPDQFGRLGERVLYLEPKPLVNIYEPELGLDYAILTVKKTEQSKFLSWNLLDFPTLLSDFKVTSSKQLKMAKFACVGFSADRSVQVASVSLEAKFIGLKQLPSGRGVTVVSCQANTGASGGAVYMKLEDKYFFSGIITHAGYDTHTQKNILVFQELSLFSHLLEPTIR
jgi:hypothetical protein